MSTRNSILTQLHASHQGIEKTRMLAKENVFWPGINKDIELLCKKCSLCQEMLPQQPKEPMKMHEKPLRPWVKVGTADLFEVEGKNYLIISDYFSRFPIVKQLHSTASEAVIKATKKFFSLFGSPKEIMSDNGPQFLNQYNLFCEKWGIKHTTSSPRHPQSNGFIERQIRYLKPIVRKCLKENGDLNAAL